MSVAGAPFLGEADPGDSGEEEVPAWQRLRQLPEACWIGLAMPRFLLRLPYGKKTDSSFSNSLFLPMVARNLCVKYSRKHFLDTE